MELDKTQIAEITEIVKDDERITRLVDYFKTKLADVGIPISDINTDFSKTDFAITEPEIQEINFQQNILHVFQDTILR